MGGGGGEGVYFSWFLQTPPAAYFDPSPRPPFINFSNFTRDYCKRLRIIPEIPILSEVNKVFKDNPNFVSSLLYYVTTSSFILTAPPPPPPPFNNFSQSLKLPRLIWPPVYYEPESSGSRLAASIS